ncbi:signal peptidase I [Paractinoplanes lichenicola]|uniref:Signal peptidase I n=1 Tax=Paractinoplanes lichenicola TaxID=2802976 RepID=A0ABS1W359_9ACTN|nr:signal peptidase I [Actinoplanes lichenicola]MBL7261158.1 signal peptidase I [Actinoplanes lichenicola]
MIGRKGSRQRALWLLLDVRDAVVACLIGMLLVAAAPVVIGWRSTVVVSGSMQPSIKAGDVVAARPVPRADRTGVKPGTVVLVEDPAAPGRLLLHRLVRYDEQGRLILKGDANRSADSTPVPPEQLRGVARLKVPFIGLPYLWVQEGQYLPVVAFAVLLIALIAWQPRDSDDEDPAPSSEWPLRKSPQPQRSWRPLDKAVYRATV